MVWIPFDHRFEGRDDFFGALARSSIHHPQPLGMKVHTGFGEQRVLMRERFVRLEKSMSSVFSTTLNIPIPPAGTIFLRSECIVLAVFNRFTLSRFPPVEWGRQQEF